ncbi:MAG: prolyl oligopeptidase family serine peptidase [Bryobacteraceae bacterium]|nr:prolyl oligopeptidase family serine peptidase [Bryobacteraceae bacterium]
MWLLIAMAVTAAHPQSSAVLDDLENRARGALERVPRARNKAQAEAARAGLRRQLEASLGHRKLPWPPDPRASVVGVIPKDGYRIEKLVFQTLPGVWAPAHLYLPAKVEGRVPAVLFYNGHWWPDSKSRPDFQAFCINMARMGFVVLSFDPFGQGERGVSSRDHRRTETLLVGVSQQGIAEYETESALEYLLSRREVDPARVGMTGASGGGFNTWITAALDDRIAAVVPVVGTSDFFEQIHVTRELDWYRAAEHCHFVPGLIRYANNHELLAMIAPRPLLIISAAVDQSFPVAGVREVHRYGEELYASYGVRERAGLYVDEREGHGYQKAKREAAYGWFLRYLMGKGDGGAVAEPETVTLPYDAPELKCFPEGKRPAGPGIITMVERMARKPGANKTRLSEAGGPEGGLRAVVDRLGPADGKGVLVAVDDRGRRELAGDPVVREAISRGWSVWAADPRGIGGLAVDKPGWVFAVSLLLGENFVEAQGRDIRRLMEQAPSGRPVALYANGHNAALAATFALAQGVKAEWTLLRGGFVSFRQFFLRPASMSASFRLLADDVREQRKSAFDREIPHEYFYFGILEQADIPGLLGGAASKVFVSEPISGDWAPMDTQAARKMLPSVVNVTGMEAFLRRAW